MDPANSSGCSKPHFRISMVLLGFITLTGARDVSSVESSTNALTPEQELASFRLADDRLTIELVAAEPDVISPVAMAFDADGRLFVAEMIDYPKGPMPGRIKLLEDRDGDGHYKQSTVFADNLSFPNGVLPWKGGLLVTAAPNIWYLKDADGDGRADERRVLFSGFGLGNQQLRANGLFWGLDNWVYGANGRSDGEVRGDASSKPVSIRGHDFRFRPGGGEFEAIAGRSQFGSARDDWGNRFLSWNTIPIRHEVLPERYLNRNPNLASTESLLDIMEAGDTGRVFPLTPPPLTFNDESVKNFNALAGLTIYRGDALGEKYRGNAFMGESLLNLVHRRVLNENGVSFIARRGERETEFLASTDPWFHAVNFATGPDGALYVADFYRRFVEHPDFVHGKAHDEVPWRTGAEHGRIWRIKSSGSRAEKRKPSLAQARSIELVGHLNDANGWWRDTAQRLLVERQDRAVIPELEQLARHGSAALSRLHALYTLDGLGAFTPDLVVFALNDSHPRVREHALRLSEPFVSVQSRGDSDRSAEKGQTDRLRAADTALSADPDDRVRFQLALTLGQFDGEAKLNALIALTRRDFADRWHALAILSSLGSSPWPFVKKLADAEPKWLDAPANGQANFLDRVASVIGARHDKGELRECITLLTQATSTPPDRGRLAILAGLADGLARSRQPLRALLSNPSAEIKDQVASLNPLIVAGSRIATSREETVPDRLLAIRILARITPQLAGKGLLDLLQPEEPAEIQSAAVRALSELDDDSLANAMFVRWSQYAESTRRRVLAAVPRSPVATAALATALERGNVSPVELDASVRQTLLKTSNDPMKQRLKKVLENVSTPDREQVLKRFEPALRMEGDRERGAAIFSKGCLVCHTVQGHGGHVGPDLSGIASRPKEALLVDILDPSRQVSRDFINYTLETMEGKILTGLIVSETGGSVTLRRAGEPDDIILRTQVKELRAEGKSLMPEGLEQGLSQQAVADLLAFLQRPEGQMISEY